jgi:hypothetical protein
MFKRITASCTGRRDQFGVVVGGSPTSPGREVVLEGPGPRADGGEHVNVHLGNTTGGGGTGQELKRLLEKKAPQMDERVAEREVRERDPSQRVACGSCYPAPSSPGGHPQRDLDPPYGCVMRVTFRGAAAPNLAAPNLAATAKHSPFRGVVSVPRATLDTTSRFPVCDRSSDRTSASDQSRG